MSRRNARRCCAASSGRLDALRVRPCLLDILAGQVPAERAGADWAEGGLLAWTRRAAPSADLCAGDFGESRRAGLRRDPRRPRLPGCLPPSRSGSRPAGGAPGSRCRDSAAVRRDGVGPGDGWRLLLGDRAGRRACRRGLEIAAAGGLPHSCRPTLRRSGVLPARTPGTPAAPGSLRRLIWPSPPDPRRDLRRRSGRTDPDQRNGKRPVTASRPGLPQHS